MCELKCIDSFINIYIANEARHVRIDNNLSLNQSTSKRFLPDNSQLA